ncbi:MAG TPA: IclR family transcriptional regulator [Vicinamibacteria bacterium]
MVTARPKPGRYSVDAVAKALRILGEFSTARPRISLADLPAQTGIPRATAFRLLATLEEAGFVVREDGGYRLGLKCFVLGNVAAAEIDLRNEAHPYLAALRDSTGETAQIAILDQWQVVYLERVPSRRAVGYMTSRAGTLLPAYCTGLGKALLAYRPEAEVAAWAETQSFSALTPTTLTSAARLLEELRGIRARGYAVDEQERELGVRCVAAPVRDHRGEVVAAISIAGPAERMPRVLVGSKMADKVVATAREISFRLGHEEARAAGRGRRKPASARRR